MKTKTGFHKLTAWLLTLAMLMTFIPSFTVTASAADAIAWTDTDGDGVQDSGEKTWDCLSDALEAGGTVRMLGDYHLPNETGYDEKYYYIKMTKGTAVLDLNGYTLKLSSVLIYAKERSFDLSGAADLTVTDSKGGGVLAFTTGINSAVYLSDSAKLTFAGGTIDTRDWSPLTFNVVINKSGSSEFTITGGAYNANPTEHVSSDSVVSEGYESFTVMPKSEIVAWLDWDYDGLIDSDERVFTELSSAIENNVLNLTLNPDAKATVHVLPEITMSPVSLDLNGCTLTVASTIVIDGGRLIINYGSLKSQDSTGNVIEVRNGGEFKAESGYIYGKLINAGGTITLTGGHYDTDPTEHLSEDYVAVRDASDELWSVLSRDNLIHFLVTLSQNEYIYDGTAKTPDVTVKLWDKTFEKDIDYTVSYSNNTAAGTGMVTVTFIKDFNGTITKEFNIRELEISASPDSIYPPIGEETSTLTLSASVNGTDVTANTNWTLEDTYAGISISGNVITVTSEAVSGTVVKVKGSYLDGVSTYSFTLEDTPKIPLPDFTLSADSTTYNGTEQKPTVEVSGLTEGTDYTVTYKRGGTETNDFTSAGEITVEVTGIGDYSGTKTGTYTIKQKSIADAVATLTPINTTYNGAEQKPVYTLTLDGAELVEGRDYYIRTDPAEPDYTNAGATVFYFNGQGNYTDRPTAIAYVIYKKTIAEADVTISANTVWNGSAQIPTVTVSGVPESDYTVTYTRDGENTTDFTSCGTITVTIADARGNCSGSVSKDYVIDHDADGNCGHALLMYQAPGSEQVEYTNDVSYLAKEGTITLLDDVTVDTILHCRNTTIVMNGHSITFTSTSDRFLASYYGSLTIDASAGGRIGCDKPAEWYVSLVYLYKPLKIIGNLEFDPNFGIRLDVPTESLDLSQYTGDGLIIRNYSTTATFTPILPSGYGIVSWTFADGPTDTVYDGNTIPKYKYGMVKMLHTHDWKYELDSTNTNTIKATCDAAGCPETGAKTIVISASGKVYDGTAVTATVTNNVDSTDYNTSIVYEAKTGELTDGKAVNVGTYTAKITVGGVTASVDFEITPVIYSVTVNAATNGTVTANPTTAAAGTTITLTVTPADGYEVDTVSYNDGTSDVEVTEADGVYSFTMPANDVVITASFEQLSHTHNWKYESVGTDTVKATCTAENCPNTDGGSITIAAPESLDYTGEAIDVVVTNNLVDKWFIFNVLYTAAEGSELTDGKPVKVGTYTASINIYGATASVEYSIAPVPVVTEIKFDRESPAYDEESNTFYVSDTFPFVLEIVGENLEMLSNNGGLRALVKRENDTDGWAVIGVTIESDTYARATVNTFTMYQFILANSTSKRSTAVMVENEITDTQYGETLYVNLEPATTFFISATASPEEGGTVTGGGTYDENAEVTVSATENDGYIFAGWTENGETVSTDASYTFNASGNRQLVAVFEKYETINITVNLVREDGNTPYDITYEDGTTYSSRARITITKDGEQAYSATEDADCAYSYVSFSTELLTGTYTLTVTKPGYVTFTNKIEVTLEGINTYYIYLTPGDIRGSYETALGDGIVDIDDFIRVLRGFDSDAPSILRSSVDINEDGAVNVTDLSIIKAAITKASE